MSNKPQMTKLEIIDELIVKGYAINPSTRGVNASGTNCIYRNLETDNRCAVGKCITDKYIKEFGQFEGSVDQLGGFIGRTAELTLDEIMFEKYRGHDVKFWELVQIYHDSSLNFDEVGLTDNGKYRLVTLKEKVAELK